MKRVASLLLSSVFASSCAAPPAAPPTYLDYSGCDDRSTGGIKRIPIKTTKGTMELSS